MPKKHLNKDKKKRAVKRQGCCGLFACLYALGIKVKTAEDIEKYRRMCLEKGLVPCPHGKRWLGGTTRWDRTRILNHFGAKVESVPFRGKTLERVLKDKSIYQTKGDYLVTVTKTLPGTCDPGETGPQNHNAHGLWRRLNPAPRSPQFPR